MRSFFIKVSKAVLALFGVTIFTACLKALCSL